MIKNFQKPIFFKSKDDDSNEKITEIDTGKDIWILKNDASPLKKTSINSVLDSKDNENSFKYQKIADKLKNRK